MTSNSTPEFAELVAGCERSAVHFEARDTYFSNSRFEAWQRGERTDWENRSAWWRPFHQSIADAVSRGVVVRRTRVVSEPVTDYIRWEHYQTRANVEAGEQVRWLPRRRATGLLLPANDFWIFDNRLMRVHHFSGAGEWIDNEMRDDPPIVSRYAAAFEEAWQRATTHAEYDVK